MTARAEMESVGRASGASHRARILAELRAAPDGLVVSDIAARLALHPNTTRWHLGNLLDAGLVRSRALHRGTPGRPQIVYEATSEKQPADGYRFLAELLASALALSPGGTDNARAAGRAWGRHLVDEPPPFARVCPEEALERIRVLLDEHGFEPEVEDDTVVMRRCPFHGLVEFYGQVVCTLHGGLVEGALEALGGVVELAELRPYAEPGVCEARMRR